MSRELVFLEGERRVAAIEAARQAFHPQRDPRLHGEFVRQALDSPWARRCQRFPALVDAAGTIVASVRLHDMPYRLDGRRLRIAGIGSLTLRSEHRGEDPGRRLLEAVHETLASEDYDGAVVFSTAGAPYYERLGYEALPLPTLLADLRDYRTEPRTGDSESVIRPYEDGDFDAVRNLYNTATSLQRLALLRDDEYWQHGFRRGELARTLLAQPASLLVGEREGRVVSYLRASCPGPQGPLAIDEAGFEPGAAWDVGALLTSLLDAMGRDAPGVLDGAVPTRFANLLPARRMMWSQEPRQLMMMKSFGGFEVPTSTRSDDRFVWPCDWI